MNLIHYSNTSNKEVVNLINKDITYSVLTRILQNTCTDIYTNNESVIICYSFPPYPIWVWCKDITNKEDVNSVCNCLKDNYLSNGKYNIILSHELLNELKRIDSIYKDLSLKMELYSYQLDKINEIAYPCDGKIELANSSNLKELTYIFKDMFFEMEGFSFDLEECKNRVMRHIENQTLFTLKNENDEILAITSKSDDGVYAKISSVYTVPKYRRRGYAINLVHYVTELLLEQNLIPILYTNGGYVASNECYKKIGYYQVGRLCNVENR